MKFINSSKYMAVKQLAGFSKEIKFSDNPIYNFIRYKENLLPKV